MSAAALDSLRVFLRSDAVAFLSGNTDDEKPHCLVFYDPCYRNAIEQYSSANPSSRYIFSRIGPSDKADFSLYGRCVNLPVALDPANYSVVFIAHAKASLHNFALYFYAYTFR